MVLHLADNTDPNSWASRLRRRRVQRLAELVTGVDRELRILDVGGTGTFWMHHRSELPGRVRITVVNVREDLTAPVEPGIEYVVGDGRCMDMFGDGEFDLCFSNSVIEHVGSYEEQMRMANEVRRVARGYFVQTPNRYFPIEPHFLFPGWQFLPIGARAWLLQQRKWGWVHQQTDPGHARVVVSEIELLSEQGLRGLFPDARILRERVGPLVKSLIATRSVESDGG